MKRVVMLLVLACVAAAPAPAPTVKDVMADCAKLQRMTKEGHPMSPEFTILCGQSTEDLRRGLHNKHWSHILWTSRPATPSRKHTPIRWAA
jgi:hypothetical protein